MDLVSIIVPVFNTEKYLDRCIQSLLNQTYQNVEVILVDDGSKDRSPKICDNWMKKDNRVKVIHQINSGVSVARNKGIAASTGEFIMQVDSDDYIYQDTILIMHDALLKNGADLAICEFEKGKDEHYQFIFDTKRKEEVIDARCALGRIYDNQENALQYAAPCAKLYKKYLFDGIKYPEGKIFEDIYITHHILAKCHKIVVVPQRFVYYFQHSDSITNRKYHIGKLVYLDAIKERITFFDSLGYEDLSQTAYDEYLHCLIWEYSRARDLLANKEVMQDIKKRYRKAYIRGHVSKRYPAETKRFLYSFYLEPEIIIWYWRIKAKIQQIRNG